MLLYTAVVAEAVFGSSLNFVWRNFVSKRLCFGVFWVQRLLL